ncbi:glycine-rich domain-containing protein [Streptomyces sp. NPDC058657]|uniref:glycine-rich domain-containing protein n=1 Tax=unclassified Streptomyces TaxID=2593676 RepID=UPI00366642E5
MTIALEHPLSTTDPSTLVEPDTMQRLAARIVKDHPEIDVPTAHRIIGQTAGFLAASASAPGRTLSPSEPVDIGWHTWILHTVDYASFCQRVAGYFIHHVPTAGAKRPEGGPKAALQRTMNAIMAAGYTVDTALWPEIADCSQCHAGCSNSPKSK